MNLFVIIVIAISLSMDAFSLSLAYGTLNLCRKNIYQLSIIVGIYHFFMPLFGNIFGKKLFSLISVNSNNIVFLVLFIIGIEMIIETFKDHNEIKIMNLWELLLFGFAVSIDSFSVGIGLNVITSNVIVCVSVFSIISFIFTYCGLLFGKKINNIFGKISTLLGGFILIIIAIIYLL